MAGDARIYVQSLDPAGAYPVAVTYEQTAVGTAAIQWFTARSSGQPLGTVVASVPGVVSVVASIPGTVGATQQGSPWGITGSVVGSVQATQGTVPWVVQGSVTGTVVASLPGQTTVTASIAGTVPVQPAHATVTASVAGTVPVAPTHATVTASVAGTVPVSIAGQVSVTASLPGTIAASVSGTVVASVIGTVAVQPAHATVTASLPGTIAASVTGTVVASVIGTVTAVGSVRVTQAGSLFVGLTGPTGLATGVSSYGGDGNLLRVDVVRTSGSGGGDGALVDGADGTIKASVRSYANANPLAVVVVDATGAPAGGNTIVGSVVATQGGTWAVSQSDSLSVFQGAAPWLMRSTSGSVVVGSVLATQGGAPWTVIASVVGTIPASVSGTVVASVVGVPTVSVVSFTPSIVASLVGQPTVTASLIGVPTVSVVSLSAPVNALQSGTWATRPTSTGEPMGTVVASVIGNPTVIASVAGNVPVTQAGSFVVTANQGGAPWTVSVISLTAPLTTVTSVIGVVVTSLPGNPTVVASVIGQPTVTASLIGVPTVSVVSLSATVTAGGSVWVSQVSSPWVTREVRGQAYESHELTIPGSRGNMSFTSSLVGTHAASCTCATSAFSALSLARAVTIRNMGPLEAKFRFRTASAHPITVDAGETFHWTALEVSEFFVTTTSLTAIRVLLA